jgi:hypothetical protein
VTRRHVIPPGSDWTCGNFQKVVPKWVESNRLAARILRRIVSWWRHLTKSWLDGELGCGIARPLSDSRYFQRRESTMDKRLFLFVFAVVVFFRVGTVFSQDQVPAPAFKEGDTWLFNIARETSASSTLSTHGMYELKFTKGNLKLYEVNGDQRDEMTITSDGPAQGLLALVGKSEQRPILKFPFSVGQKWTYQYRITSPGERRPHNRSVEVNVAGIETVSTSAGVFKAYKLQTRESWLSGRSNVGGTESTYFYSPDTGSMIKRSTQNIRNPATVETELIKFTPGN